jgi:hypothetical protein
MTITSRSFSFSFHLHKQHTATWGGMAVHGAAACVVHHTNTQVLMTLSLLQTDLAALIDLTSQPYPVGSAW